MSMMKRRIEEIEIRRMQFQQQYEMPTGLSTDQIFTIIASNPNVSGKRIVQIMRKLEDTMAEQAIERERRHRRNQEGRLI